MMLLVYGNRKEDDIIYDISTPEQRSSAFLRLFNHLKDDWQVYDCGYWGGKYEENTQKILYKEACKGNAEAAEKLIMMRRTYEYEEVKIVEAQ